ncbi:hypothetical protein KFL_010850010 [Klebsormidium nitens]|uniref:MMS19 nucleotide excision repair protein n=1 Tax=Klebsormidium nitens TaxID=105231 RepID=A0A1Y1IPQ0_KLENI|nr:hypothetical protein KFL_010850010 [Klebsormidium nitens]|eukprot:GAQ92653.1 hypothetical protein KFL_010850010 [Klebsormidium nitens]
MADLQARVQEFVNPELPGEVHNAALTEILDAVRQERLSVPQLVGSLAEQLTTEDNGIRARACQLLAGVIKGIPDVPLQDTAIHSLAEFFASRLADFPSLRGALTGSLALLKRTPEVGALHPTDAVEIAKAVLNSVHVQSLTAVDRLLSFEVLETLIESHPSAVLALEGDFLDGLVAAIDGEKDPRCLLLAFRLVEIAPKVFVTGQSAVLAEAAEELFEVIAVYFPVSFNPPPNDTRGISREDLVVALERALAATPLFAPYSLPLFIEKLGSSLTSAKLDSLRALRACAQSYGSAIASQTGPLWTALKNELLPLSVEASSAGEVGPVPERSAEVGDAAVEALTQCVRALEGVGRGAPAVSNPLVRSVLEDPTLGDLFIAATGETSIPLTKLLNHGGQSTHSQTDPHLDESQPRPVLHQTVSQALSAAPHDSEGQARRREAVERWSGVLSAVATAGAGPCRQVAEAVMARVTSAGSVGYTGLRLLSKLAGAARTLVWTGQGDVSRGFEGGTGRELDAEEVLGGKAEALGEIFSGVVRAWQAEGGVPDGELNDLATLAVDGLEALASLPPPLSQAESNPLRQNCISVLVSVLFSPGSDPHTPNPLQQKALQALASISRGPPSKEPPGTAEPNTGVTRGEVGDSWHGARQVWAAVSERLLQGSASQGFSLQIFATLAESSGVINREVLQALERQLDRLWGAVGGSVESESEAVEVLRLLAREILPKFGSDESDQELVLHFVHALLERLATWPSPRRPNDGLLAAALGALCVAMRICTEANQAALLQKAAGGFFQALEGDGVWRSGPVLAILVALRPSVSAEAGQPRVLQGLLSLALQSSDALIADAASVALASLLKKWPAQSVRHVAAQETSLSAFHAGGASDQLDQGGGTEAEPEGRFENVSTRPYSEEANSPHETRLPATSTPSDTALRTQTLGQPFVPFGVSTPPHGQPAARMTPSPVTPASTQALPSVSPPSSAATSDYSPAIFLDSSPQSVLFDTTPVSILQPGFSPAGGLPGPSPDPPGTTAVFRAPSPGDIPPRARRVAQRLDLSRLGGAVAASNTAPRGPEPTNPPERSPQKLAGGDGSLDLESALRVVLDERLLPLLPESTTETGQKGLEAQIRGVRVLAVVGQALAMRGHKRTGDVVGALVQLLFTLGKAHGTAGGVNASSGGSGKADGRGGPGEGARNGMPRVSAATLSSFQPEAHTSRSTGESLSPSAGSPQDDQPSASYDLAGLAQLADVAAEGFGVIAGERRSSNPAESSTDLNLSKETHAQIKPLYRQRLFTMSLGPFSEAVRKAKNPEERLPLYRGLAHLLRGTPPAALAVEAEKVLLLLLESLSALAASSDVRAPRPASDAPLVLSDLLTLTSFLTDGGPAREHASEHVPSIVRTLVRLTAYGLSASVRETALQALVAAADLPFTRVYPLRNEVHKAILGALDDPKRAVRKEAVRCRRVWTALGSSKK